MTGAGAAGVVAEGAGVEVEVEGTGVTCGVTTAG